MSRSVNTLTLTGKGLPEILHHIDHPPKQLYCLGSPLNSWQDKPKVAVVGSRKVTAYGQAVTEQLVSELASAGAVIISGLALGMDGVAHRAALKAGGITAAVLPCGLDRIYPASHRNLALEILRHEGSIITEYPKGHQVRRYHFVERNRIVAALADVLLITEAALKSGTMHTARFAINQGKTVMAVPGNINSPMSEGCNNLIKSGALAATDVSDIFFALGIDPAKRARASFKGSSVEKQVLSLIEQGTSDQEELAALAKLDVPQLVGVLTSLELAAQIRPAGNGHWVLN